MDLRGSLAIKDRKAVRAAELDQRSNCDPGKNAKVRQKDQCYGRVFFFFFPAFIRCGLESVARVSPCSFTVSSFGPMINLATRIRKSNS